MPDPNPYGMIPQNNSLLGMPGPNYNILGSGNPALDSLFAMLVPQLVGQGKFLPQLAPAQGILDQMISSKYMQSARAAERSAHAEDQRTVLRNFLKVRQNLSSDPVTPLQTAQLDEAAYYANSEPVQMLASMAFGAQNVEDAMFGRRGSKVRLSRAIGQIGFSRPDSLVGGDRMSEDSLKTFTDQIYSNLYGPDADLNDVAGFSAGRVGDIMSGLAQRGLLPQSTSRMTAYERNQVFTDKSLRDKSFSPQINAALDANASIDELVKLPGGDDAVRKIDATRVSNTIKGYTDALSAVREIFGDNGMANAPMGQLMAAMDALTQNSMSSMSPGKIENTMRRMQMASRDAGVSLEALMGLTGRSGALADKYGLSREIATENVIGAMERGRALRDTGGFTPGFARMDPTKATLFALDQGMRADASPVGRMIATVNRIVEEQKNDPAFAAGRGRNLVKMVEAIKLGQSTYFDDTTNKQVNIYKELGERPGTFLNQALTAAGISMERADAYYRDSNTQEFAIGNRAYKAQAHELKQDLAEQLSTNGGLTDALNNAKVNQADADSLNQRMSQSISTALVDTVNTTMSPTERIEVLRRAMRRGVISHYKNAGSDEATARGQADALIGTMFKTPEALQEFLGGQQGRLGTYLEANYGMQMGRMQQMFNIHQLAEANVRQQNNVSRAAIFAGTPLGDGSNFLQRFADSGGNPIAALGTITDPEMRKQFYAAAAGSGTFDSGKAAVEGTLTAAEEQYKSVIQDKDAVMADLLKGNIADVQKRLVNPNAASLLDGVTRVQSTADTAAALKAAYTDDKHAAHTVVSDLLEEHYGSKAALDKAIAAGKDVYADMAGKVDLQGRLLSKDADFDLRTVGLGDGVKTESDMRAAFNSQDVLRSEAGREHLRVWKQFGEQLRSGEMTGKTAVDLFITDPNVDDKTRSALAATFQSGIDNAADLDTRKKTLDALTTQMTNAGVADAEQQNLLKSFQTGAGSRLMGGFGFMGNEKSVAMLTTLQAAVDSGKIAADSDLGKKIAAGGAEAQKLAADKEARDTALEAHALATGGNVDQTIAQVEKDAAAKAAELTGASAGAETGGIGKMLADSFAPAIKDVMSTALKDIKIENVTITNINMPGLADELGNAVASALNNAAKSGGVGGAVLSGVLKVIGLDRAVVEAQQQDKTTYVPDGTSVK
jgi:hypothetical protein